MAPHSSTLAHGVSKSRKRLSDFTFTFHFSLSCIGEGNGNPLQCSCLENPRDGRAWWAAIYGVAQSRTRLKQLSSSSSSFCMVKSIYHFKVFWFLESLQSVIGCNNSFFFTQITRSTLFFSFWSGHFVVAVLMTKLSLIRSAIQSAAFVRMTLSKRSVIFQSGFFIKYGF